MFYGTPLQSEEAESKRQHEFQKRDVKDAGAVKALPVWQQAHNRSIHVQTHGRWLARQLCISKIFCSEVVARFS